MQIRMNIIDEQEKIEGEFDLCNVIKLRNGIFERNTKNVLLFRIIELEVIQVIILVFYFI